MTTSSKLLNRPSAMGLRAPFRALAALAVGMALSGSTSATAFTDHCIMYGAESKPAQADVTLWPNGKVPYLFTTALTRKVGNVIERTEVPLPKDRASGRQVPCDPARDLADYFSSGWVVDGQLWTQAQMDRVRQGMKFWEEATGLLIDFVEGPAAREEEGITVSFPTSDACCSSSVGRKADGQATFLQGANDQKVQHELGHLLGLRHQHQRHDRERFIHVEENLYCKGDPHIQASVLGVDIAGVQDACHIAEPMPPGGYNDLSSRDVTGFLGGYAELCRAYDELITDWVGDNVTTFTDTDFGPYNPTSVMHYGCGSGLCALRRKDGTNHPKAKASGQVVVSGTTYENYVTDRDASQLVEMYAEEVGWSRFRPVYRADPGPTTPLDMNLIAGVSLMGAPALGLEKGRTVWAIALGDTTKKFYAKSWSHTGFPSNGKDFQVLPGNWISDPAIASRSDGVLTVAGVGENGSVWYVHRIDGTWGTPKSLGRPVNGVTPSAPAVVWDGGDFSVVVRSGESFYERKYTSASGWGASWKKQACCFKGKPAVVSWGPGRYDVVGVGKSDGVWHVPVTNGKWVNPQPLGGAVLDGTSPAIASAGVDHLNVYVTGQNGRLWHRSWDGTWSNWQDLGGLPEGSPAAVTTPDMYAHVAINFLGTGLYHRRW